MEELELFKIKEFIQDVANWNKDYSSAGLKIRAKKLLGTINETTDEMLVSFGNYLLSEERKNKTSEINHGNVTHADIENWKNSLTK